VIHASLFTFCTPLSSATIRRELTGEIKTVHVTIAACNVVGILTHCTRKNSVFKREERWSMDHTLLLVCELQQIWIGQWYMFACAWVVHGQSNGNNILSIHFLSKSNNWLMMLWKKRKNMLRVLLRVDCERTCSLLRCLTTIYTSSDNSVPVIDVILFLVLSPSWFNEYFLWNFYFFPHNKNLSENIFI
jgi:hypothetical protein